MTYLEGRMQNDPLARQAMLVAALLSRLRAGGAPTDLYETHISWVLVQGPDAWKIKKALRLDFLDFSTLALRRHWCEEEVRLNAALAPGLYLGTVAVTGTPAEPQLGGEGEPIEAAVHMRAFPPQALWSERIALGLLGQGDVDELAALLAGFHFRARRAPPGSPWGTAPAIASAGERNMDELAALVGKAALSADLAGLRTWRAAEARRLATCFDERKRIGAVRQCHGDLHCDNLLTFEGRVMAFDCIEFDESLRWLDVMHDLAFALMDLRRRGQAGLAARLLNSYLEHSGDYEGLAVMRYYMTECALVRAKIAVLRQHDDAGTQDGAIEDQASSYIATAWQTARPLKPALVVMHGLSGSGKSTVARRLVELFGAVQVRSDVERRRTPGVNPAQYDRHTSNAVYKRLRAVAGNIIAAGFPALIDAANLRQSERDACRRLAKVLGIPWMIVDVRASLQTMRERIEHRRADGTDPSDADLAVLEMQRRQAEQLTAQELARTVIIDTGQPLADRTLREGVSALWHR
jgi:aminoglycoside phosphotransferase family enzyme/predicted kinase